MIKKKENKTSQRTYESRISGNSKLRHKEKVFGYFKIATAATVNTHRVRQHKQPEKKNSPAEKHVPLYASLRIRSRDIETVDQLLPTQQKPAHPVTVYDVT